MGKINKMEKRYKKDINRHLTENKTNVFMTNKEETVLNLTNSQEIQIKATVRYRFTPTDNTKS